MATELMKQELVAQGTAANVRDLGPACVLSVMAAVLSAAVSVIGLLFPGLYRGEWSNGMSRANDLVTLVVAVPVLALGIIYSARGSVRARLLWLGALYFMVYNYAFYVFGIPVTRLYVPWIALFVLAGFAFLLGMGRLDVKSIAVRFSPRAPARLVAAYLFYVAVMVCFLWISQWVKFVATGKIPDVNGSQFAYQVIAAVDLIFLVPLFFSAAYLLFRRRPWGYVLAPVALVQGATYTAVMATVCVFGWRLTPGSQLFSGWFINCLVGCTLSLLCLAGLLLSVKRPEMTSRAA